ncbi:MAG TPA: CdaR family protein [Pyrinomonadaceae bacterium]|jgi:YbbR domain-containing protein|nr:CdaR family protein [Pyrinomonadaceae bacterium]
MPFPEINDIPRRPAHRPHWAQRWLRQIFVEDLGLKVLALLISLALWYGVTGQRSPTTIRVPRVPLNFRLPGDTEISNEPRTEVEVTMTGSKRALDTINVRDLIVNVDVSDLKPGEYQLQLTPERVTMGLPDGVHYGDIQPNNVLLRLETRVERELEVEVRHAGDVPAGYELKSIVAVPEKVKVRGPASHVNGLQKVPTQIISLEGHKENFTLPQAAIEIDDKKVDLIEGAVLVRVEIGERPITKMFTNVSVQALPGLQASPGIAAVTLYGPPSLLNKLSAADFQIALDSGPDGSIKPRLILPADMEGRIELRSYKPQ